MIESKENLLKTNELNDKLLKLESFLHFKWDNFSIPIIDVDFFDLFSRLVINKNTFKFSYELSKNELKTLVDTGEVTDRKELDKIKIALSRMDRLSFEEYLSQNTLAIFKNPEFYISTLNDSLLHTPLNKNDLNNNLNLINLKNKKMLNENGLSNLYLALGFLASSDFNAPLIFIPVKLEKENDDFELSYDSHDKIRLNTSLELELKEKGIDLPQMDIRLESDMISYLTSVNKLCKIEPFVTLGLFDFTVPIAFNDLNEFSESEELDNILNGCDKTFHFDESKIDLIDEHDSYNVLDADSSQISAIREALLGGNLFIDAPSSSNKTDTIINLISEIVANKKTVLYISDKLNEIREIEDKLSELGLKNLCLDLYGNNYDYQKLIEEIMHASRNIPQMEYDENYINSKLNELNKSKRELAEYSDFINTPYKNTGITPYGLMGIIENGYRQGLDEFEMKNLSDLSEEECLKMNDDFTELSEFYANKIYPASENKFNYILVDDNAENQLEDIISSIHDIERDMRELIEVNEELHEKFGIEKLEKLNDYENHLEKLKSLENSPQLMGDDFEGLKDYVDSLNDFQIKTKEFGTIENLEKMLLVDVYNTRLDLENQLNELINLDESISKLFLLLEEFKSKVSDAGINNVKSIREVEEIEGDLDVLDKNPAILSDEENMKSFVEDMEKYQSECEANSPEDLLTTIDNISKATLSSTTEQLKGLTSYHKNVREVDTAIDELNALKNVIGLNCFKSVNGLKEDLQKTDVLRSSPVIVEDENAIDEFISLFKRGSNEFGDYDYSHYYSQINSEVDEIQDNIINEVSQTRILENNLPAIKSEIKNISDNVNRLSNLLNIKPINSLREIDEYCDNVGILLKNPIVIPSSEKPQIFAYVTLLEDIINKAAYTKLDLDEVNDLIKKIIAFDKKINQSHFDYRVFNLDFKELSLNFSEYSAKLSSSPIQSPLSPDNLNEMLEEFSNLHQKMFKNPLGRYGKLKREFKSYYRITPPDDDGVICSDYKKYIKIEEDIHSVKNTLLVYYKSDKSMSNAQFKSVLENLTSLKDEYGDIKKEIDVKLKETDFNSQNMDFDETLNYLVSIKLKLTDIQSLSKDAQSAATAKEKRGSAFDSIKSAFNFNSKSINIHSLLKKYFPKTYFYLDTDLDDLYDECLIKEDYDKLLKNGFFEEDSPDKADKNKNEVKNILESVEHSKTKCYYILKLIKQNIEVSGTQLDMTLISKSSFAYLIGYFDDLSDEIKSANDLFNGVRENYKIDEIDKIIENYEKLNSLKYLGEFVKTEACGKSLFENADYFKLLNEFNSMEERYSLLINRYFQNIWTGKSTSLDDLQDAFENNKEFTKLYHDGFYSDAVFKFLEKPPYTIQSVIDKLNSKCAEISQKTKDLNGQSVFYKCDLEEIDFEEYQNKNKEVLGTLELLNRYDLIYGNYDEIINFDEKADFESLDLVNQLDKDLNKLYNDSAVIKYEISFESQNNLDKITEIKNDFIKLVRLRNSIEERTEIIQNHFENIWDGPNTDISLIKNKIGIDKSFTKNYDVVFSQKTVQSINDDEHSFDNYKNEFMSLFESIKTQLTMLASNPIISKEFGSELENTSFDTIYQKASDIQNDINYLNSLFNQLKLSNSFNLDEITSDVDILDNIIQSKLIICLNENLDDLNASNEKLKTILKNHNELQSIKKALDEKSIDSKYFEDIDNGYETSVSLLNQRLNNNKTYEELFNEGFFSNKTDEALSVKSKFFELEDLISKLEDYSKHSVDSLETVDLMHTEKRIYLNKSLDDVLSYAAFLEDNINPLKDWIKFRILSKNLDNEICSELIKALYDDDIELESINQIFTYNFARNLFNEIKHEHAFIHDENIEKYIDLDRKVMGLNRFRVLKEYVDARPNIENMEFDDSKSMKQYRAYDKFNDLRLNDNRSITEVFDKSIDYIKVIKPVFITTPSSVFKYLSSCDFDYVIFSDVGQIQTEYAVTTLLRGANKIVVGDSRQSDIGFTNFIKDRFKTKSLELCHANSSFSKNRMWACPNQKPSLEIIDVDESIYDVSSKVNEQEAIKIVDLAINHVNEYGFDKTLGIIAFTESQRDRIIELLLEKLENWPELVEYFNPLDSFYVKYIDDVYESRDVILASLTYGFDSDDVLNIDFESENNHVINNLLTKSLEKTIVLANFKQKDIAEGNSLRLLFENPTTDSQTDSELSLFEQCIYDYLRDNGFAVERELVDFTVNDTSIECEGENFNKFKTVRDKFRIHKELLESIGWKSFHICSADWIDNRDSYQNKLLDAVNSTIKLETEENFSLDEDFEFDFENEDEITINELKELL